MNILDLLDDGYQKCEQLGLKAVWTGYDSLEYEGKCYFKHFTGTFLFFIITERSLFCLVTIGLVEKGQSAIVMIVPS